MGKKYRTFAEVFPDAKTHAEEAFEEWKMPVGTTIQEAFVAGWNAAEEHLMKDIG